MEDVLITRNSKSLLNPYSEVSFTTGNNKHYTSVIKHLFDQFMCSGEFSTIIKNTPDDKLDEVFLNLYRSCNSKFALKALKDGYSNYFNNTQFSDELVRVGETHNIRFGDKYGLLSDIDKYDFEDFIKSKIGYYKEKKYITIINDLVREMDDIVYSKLDYYYKLKYLITNGIDDISTYDGKSRYQVPEINKYPSHDRIKILRMFNEGNEELNFIFLLEESDFAKYLRYLYANDYNALHSGKGFVQLFNVYLLYTMMIDYEIENVEEAEKELNKQQYNISTEKREELMGKFKELYDADLVPEEVLEIFLSRNVNLPKIEGNTYFKPKITSNEKYESLANDLKDIREHYDKISNFENINEKYMEKVEKINEKYREKRQRIMDKKVKPGSVQEISKNKTLMELDTKKEDEIRVVLNERDRFARGEKGKDMFLEDNDMLKPDNNNHYTNGFNDDGGIISVLQPTLNVSIFKGFPSVYHYVAYSLLTTRYSTKFRASDVVLDEAYDKIYGGRSHDTLEDKIENFENVDKLYEEILYNNRTNDVVRIFDQSARDAYDFLAYNKKFVGALVKTGDAKIVFKDKNKVVSDAISKALMEKRGDYLERKLEWIYDDVDDETEVKKSKNYFKSGTDVEKKWFKERLNEMLTTINLLSKFYDGRLNFKKDKYKEERSNLKGTISGSISRFIKLFYSDCPMLGHLDVKFGNDFVKYFDDQARDMGIIYDTDITFDNGSKATIYGFLNILVEIVNDKTKDFEGYISDAKNELVTSEVEDKVSDDGHLNLFIVAYKSLMNMIKKYDKSSKNIYKKDNIGLVVNILVGREGNEPSDNEYSDEFVKEIQKYMKSDTKISLNMDYIRTMLSYYKEDTVDDDDIVRRMKHFIN